jgi:DNA polymerase III epsilon subunit-like protein
MPTVNSASSSGLRDTPIHVIDFEGSLRTGVVEFGAATLMNGAIVAARTRLCAPVAKIPPEESRVHGISEASASRQAPFSDESAYFMQLRETGPLCAHNASFERHLIKSVWPYPRLSPDFVNKGRAVADWGPFIDTFRLYELVFPTIPEHGLQNLVETFELGNRLDETAEKYCPANRRKYHCALYDAIGAALLLANLCALPGYEGVSLEWLIAESQPQDSGVGQGELF